MDVLRIMASIELMEPLGGPEDEGLDRRIFASARLKLESDNDSFEIRTGSIVQTLSDSTARAGSAGLMGQPPQIVRIEQIFERKGQPAEALVRAFLRPGDLPNLAGGAGPRFAPHELIFSTSLEVVPLTSVIGQASLLSAADVATARRGGRLPADSFTCSKLYCRGKLSPCSADVLLGKAGAGTDQAGLLARTFDFGSLPPRPGPAAAADPLALPEASTDQPTSPSPKSLGDGRNTGAAAAALGQLLEDLEASLPWRAVGEGWASQRDRWVTAAESARTIRNVVDLVLQLERHLTLAFAEGSELADRGQWRRRVEGVHTYPLLSAVVRGFVAACTQAARESILSTTCAWAMDMIDQSRSLSFKGARGGLNCLLHAALMVGSKGECVIPAPAFSS